MFSEYLRFQRGNVSRYHFSTNFSIESSKIVKIKKKWNWIHGNEPHFFITYIYILEFEFDLHSLVSDEVFTQNKSEIIG